MSFAAWQDLIRETIHGHGAVIKPGGFPAVNVGDMLSFPEPDMPRFQADNVSRKQCSVPREDELAALRDRPGANRHELVKALGCSAQTVQRRLEGNNVRGGKHDVSTKAVLTGCLLEQWAESAGFCLHDQRTWHKDPCWANSRWHSNR